LKSLVRVVWRVSLTQTYLRVRIKPLRFSNITPLDISIQIFAGEFF
jgi:hypothetical protein